MQKLDKCLITISRQNIPLYNGVIQNKDKIYLYIYCTIIGNRIWTDQDKLGKNKKKFKKKKLEEEKEEKNLLNYYTQIIW